MLYALDWIIIGFYLLATIAVGILCRGKQDDANDYFTAGGRLSGPVGQVLVGLSIAATLFSGISLLAYPSIVYQHGLTILWGLLTFPVAWVILKFWFLPRYFKANPGGRPYDFIEDRFGQGVRRTCATLYIMLRIGWMAALIYAPTLAIIGAGGLDEKWFWPLILTLGLSSTLYTVFGGIRGVIVTDAIQFIVIAGGIGITIAYVLFNLPDTEQGPVALLSDTGRLEWLNPSLDPTTALTVWAVIIGVGIANLGSYLADQMSLQRYLASGNVRSAARAFSINVVSVFIVIIMLAMLGLSLALWYTTQPDGSLPEAADQIFPYFVATQLPAGAAGLLLAAIIAATMSSITSGINALAGSLTRDFLPPSVTQSPKSQLRVARLTSLVIGVAATVAAGYVNKLGDIFSISQSLLGVFLGPLLCVAVLALIKRPRVNSVSLSIGLVAGCVAGWAIALSGYYTPYAIYSLWVAPTAFVVTLAATIGLSKLTKNLN